MTEKIYNIKLPEEKLLSSYIDLLKPFLKGISKQEADVLSCLMYESYKRRYIPSIEERFTLILESSNRRKIEEKLDITSASFRNLLTSLKKKNLLDDKNIPKQYFLFEPDSDGITLTFNLIVDEEAN